LLPDYLDDDGYRRLQQKALLEYPKKGELMPGTGGFRNLRWQDPRRGKGKRGVPPDLVIHRLRQRRISRPWRR
jgi:hypothetical protein